MIRKICDLLRHVFGLKPLPEVRQYELSSLEQKMLQTPYAVRHRLIQQNLLALAPGVREFELVCITNNLCFYAVHPQHGTVGFTPAVVVGYGGETLRELHAQGWKPGALVDIELDATGRVLSAMMHSKH